MHVITQKIKKTKTKTLMKLYNFYAYEFLAMNVM
jgi:hypothetical protein